MSVSDPHDAFTRALAIRNVLDRDVDDLSAELRRFPVGPMGLTTDAAKASPEYRATKIAYDGAFARLRAFNASFVKTFAREIAAERKTRRAAR